MHYLCRYTLCVVPFSASAQDKDWSGFYAGFDVGHETYKESEHLGGTQSYKFVDSSVGFGAHAGGRMQFDGGMVVGAEAFYYDANVDFVSDIEFHINGDEIFYPSRKLGREMGVDMHAGLALGNGLLYGLIGVSDVSSSVGPMSRAMRYGFGYDLRFNDTSSVRLQAISTDYNEKWLDTAKRTGVTLGYSYHF